MKLDPNSHDKLTKKLAAHLSGQISKPAHVYRTHISSVIVCGEFAYKLKRPVKLPFVDFSTLKLRREDCAREVRMNQRTAPELYLTPVKITGTPDKPRLGRSGTTLDWAVKMRRFKQSDLLSHLIAAKKITGPMAQRLGKHLAEFTNSLPGLRPKVVQGHRPTIDWLLQSLDEIATVFPAQQQYVDEISTWAKCEAHHHRRLMSQRRQQGFYRNCHGDLHLSNLVKLGKKVVAFDALEFNQALSQIDVVNDIAFAFMDFLAHGRADLGWSMVNQWCEHTGDYDGMPLLRYYTLYRAVVRAKVAALTDGQSNTELFDRYWGLAKRLIAPTNPPRLVLIGGLSGSGKSTVARELVGIMSGIQIRADVIRKQLFADQLNNPNVLYARRASQQTYARLAQIADALLECNMTVIVDATFLAQPYIDRFDELADKHRTNLATLWCEAPVTVLKHRIQKRFKEGSDASDATIAILNQQIERLKAHPTRWPNQPLRLNTHGSRTDVTCQLRRLANSLVKNQ